MSLENLECEPIQGIPEVNPLTKLVDDYIALRTDVDNRKSEVKRLAQELEFLKTKLETHMKDNQMQKMDIVGKGMFYFANANKLSFQKTADITEKKKLFSLLKEVHGGLDGFLNSITVDASILGGVRTHVLNSLTVEQQLDYQLPSVKEYNTSGLAFRKSKK